MSVVQCLTLGMARRADWVRDALGQLFPDGEVLRLDDPTAARIEGFEPVRETRPAELIVEEGAGRFAVSLGAGHKTGLYLDQRENRGLVASLARGRRMLDAFCYAGGFACRALRLLEPRGLLATFSCSHHLTPALFEDICRDAAGDAAVRTRLLATLTQSRDHPILLNVPETRYLTGLLLEAT